MMIEEIRRKLTRGGALMIGHEMKLNGLATWPVAAQEDTFQRVFDQNWARIYALSFWMTDNEMMAEEVTGNVFRRAIALDPDPSPKAIDHALLAEIRELTPLGALTLTLPTVTEVKNVRQNTLRVHLERAVVQLPSTE